MTEKQHDYSKFQYFVEDCRCEFCLFVAKKADTDGSGCKLEKCPYNDIREDARNNGRFERDRGWNKNSESNDAIMQAG